MEFQGTELPSTRTRYHALKQKAHSLHSTIPWIRRLPAPAIAITALLLIVQALVWTSVGVVLSFHPALVSTAVLAYTLGLRHALDADHITIIDLVTRRLLASGQQPVTVGTFFSLGHSTIVIITSIVVAASSAAIQDRFESFQNIGSIIGSSVSSGVLIILGCMNVYIFFRLVQQLRRAIATPSGQESPNMSFEGVGCMSLLMKRVFKLVDRPWKMYPVGVLFGLGFDTSSEIALLGIASIEAAQGTSLWLILIFPILFTAGMCLLDTIDGAAMMSLYTSARLAKDNIAVLYYQCVLTAVTVSVAFVIGVLQLLSMILNIRPDLDGPFWEGVGIAGDNYDIIGGAICGSFLVFGGLSMVLYKPWRRRIDRARLAASGYDHEGLNEHGEVEQVDIIEGDLEGSGKPVEKNASGKLPSVGENALGADEIVREARTAP
jgi:high-affinity nickel-transport protein